jgi:hypothetical protein
MTRVYYALRDAKVVTENWRRRCNAGQILGLQASGSKGFRVSHRRAGYGAIPANSAASLAQSTPVY